MKIWIATGLFIGSMALLPAQEDSDSPTEEIPPAPEPVPAVVYEAPVTYEAPVVYEMPVIYYAPVFYLSTPAQLAAYCQPQPQPQRECAAPSTVVYIGGRGGSYTVTHCGESTPSVIHFGGGQACEQGYRFNHPR